MRTRGDAQRVAAGRLLHAGRSFRPGEAGALGRRANASPRDFDVASTHDHRDTAFLIMSISFIWKLLIISATASSWFANPTARCILIVCAVS